MSNFYLEELCWCLSKVLNHLLQHCPLVLVTLPQVHLALVGAVVEDIASLNCLLALLLVAKDEVNPLGKVLRDILTLLHECGKRVESNIEHRKITTVDKKPFV